MGELEDRISNLEERLKKLEAGGNSPERNKLYFEMFPEDRRNMLRITSLVIEKIAERFLRSRCPQLEEGRIEDGKIGATQYLGRLAPSLKKEFENYLDTVVRSLINAHKT